MPVKFTAGKAVMITVGLTLAAAVLFPALKSHQASTARQVTKDRLHQIGLALHSYHEQYQTFPPAFVQGPDGRMWHSWRTLLLPYLGERELAAQYRWDEPWDGPHNRELAAKCPPVFQSPHWGTEPGQTNFYAVVGRRTAWPAQHAIGIERALDGPSNTIHVVEAAPIAAWLEPHELGVREWTEAFRKQDRIGSHVVMMDGVVRRLSKNIDQTLLVSLLTPRYGELMYSGPDWPTELADSLDLTGSWKTRDARELQGTDVWAAASAPLDHTRNGIWCATFQLAWDELRSRVGGAVQTNPSPAIVAQLNAEVFRRQSLSPSAYLALATGSNSAETQGLIEQVQRKFPALVPQVESLPDDGNTDLRLYACLVKSLPFVEQMDRFPKPLNFQQGGATTAVESFGRIPTSQGGLGGTVLRDQVIVGDYIDNQSFVLVLKSISTQKDEIILARTTPSETLRSTWNSVEKRLASPHPHRVHADLHDAERLEIPILELGVSKWFEDLAGLSVLSLPNENHIGVARESILFRLDERGVDLIAEGESMVVGENGFAVVPFDPTKPRSFVFDQPFFIALREKDAPDPYFLGWLAHPEVMVRAVPTR